MTSDVALRLALIVGVDIAGYSARTEADPTRSAQEVLALRDRLAGIAARHSGRIFSNAGDGAMIEFAAAQEAVAAICELLDGWVEGEPPVRVGAHLGDVSVAANGDLLGHGVNVAARLMASASPGRALISAELKAAMGAATERPLREVGELALAKMSSKVTAFEISPSGLAPPPAPSADRGRGAAIGVFPFVNLSSEPEQEYFSDGITEDIITELSRWPSLLVAARNSTFRFKGQPVDVNRVGRELGVRFIVEGSVRRLGERVRITAQLIDTESGHHIWAERYDRPIADLFAVQDEVVRMIVSTLVGRLVTNETENMRRRPPSTPASYDLTLRANSLSWDDLNQREEAKKALERAIELDPEYGLPHTLLAAILRREWALSLLASLDTLSRARELASRGVQLAEMHSTDHTILGLVHLDLGQHEIGLRHMERGVELNPSNQWNQADLGLFLVYAGRATEGLEKLHGARKVDPYFAPLWYWRDLGVAQFALRNYTEALLAFERGASSRVVEAAMRVGCCARLELRDQTRQALEQFLFWHPQATIDSVISKAPFKLSSDREHFAECLRLAGLR